MSPRKQTVDQQGDVDDEDGTIEAKSPRPTDLRLRRRRSDEVGLGGTSVPDQEESADDREER